MNSINTSFNGTENIEPAHETQTTAPSLPGRRARTGKIARLPYAVRRELNLRMRDGEPGVKLLDWLHGLPDVQAILATQFQGHVVKKENLAQWRMGGYQDFLKEEGTRQEVRIFLEEVKGLKEEAQDGITDQLAFYLAAQMALEVQQLRAAPDGIEKAKLWRELRASLVALRRGDHEMERLRMQLEKLGLRRQTEDERKAEFWKWAEENINRDEFCRRRCFTAEEREAAIDKILGIPPREPDKTVPAEATAPNVCAHPCSGCRCETVPEEAPPSNVDPRCNEGLTADDPVKAS